MRKEEHKMTRWELPGVPAGGLRKVGQIRGTNTLILHAGQNGMLVALELLSTHTPGAPVVDDQNEFIGFISEFDVLRALEAGKDLSKLTAEDIMVHDRIAVTAQTTIEEAVKTMEEKRLLNLPVMKDGRVAYSVTRHDLLRAWVGLGTSGED
ncbi:MAG: CBS domain-containing protein [Nitrospira sp.]|jgi:CBS domain-containing protein